MVFLGVGLPAETRWLIRVETGWNWPTEGVASLNHEWFETLKRPEGVRVRPQASCAQVPAYFLLTLITLGRIFSALGMISVSSPFSKVASALSASTDTFKLRVRPKGPYLRSWM